MKKITALLTAFVMLFAFTSCTGKKTEVQSSDEKKIAGSNNGKVLIAYFSATGNTKQVAEYIAENTGGDLFELVPVKPYTDADLDWTAEGSRVNAEHNDESLRDIELVKTAPDNFSEYDTVYIGYPIWWGIAAWPVNSFVKSNDFSGKTVIPFCTSASSGLGSSDKLLESMSNTGKWLDGMRFGSSASNNDVAKWLKDIGQ